MALFSRGTGDLSLPKGDRGSGTLKQYRYDLLPTHSRVTLKLADSDPHQGELQIIVDSGELQLETAIGRRSIEEERIDAPLCVRLFAGGRVTEVVGTVPRGLEAVVDEALSRLDKRGEKVRIPATVTKTRDGLRVALLIGQTK